MHFFTIRADPTAAAANTGDIASAVAHVWVNDSDRSNAERRARAYLMDHGWIVVEVELALTPTPEQIAALDAVESANYRGAVREGIHAYFVAWPKEPRAEDSPAQVRPLPKPPSSESNN